MTTRASCSRVQDQESVMESPKTSNDIYFWLMGILVLVLMVSMFG